MPDNRQETTLAYRVQADELRDLDALLDSIMGKLGVIGGVGGFSAVGTGASAGGPSPLYNAGSALGSNSFGPGGVRDNPQATGGASYGATNGSGHAVNGYGAPAAAGRGGMEFAASSVVITAHSVTVNAQSVVFTAATGGTGGAGTQGPAGSVSGVHPTEQPGGGGAGQGGPGGPGGGGQGGGGGDGDAAGFLPGLRRFLAPAAVASFAVGAHAQAMDYMLGGETRWQQRGLNFLESVPVLGGFLATPFRKLAEVSMTEDAIGELRRAQGMSGVGPMFSDSERTAQMRAAMSGFDRLPSELEESLRNGPLATRAPLTEAYFGQRSGRFGRAAYGFAGQMSPSDALYTAVISGDYDAARAIGTVDPDSAAGLHGTLNRRMRQDLMRGLDIENERSRRTGYSASIRGDILRGDYSSAFQTQFSDVTTSLTFEGTTTRALLEQANHDLTTAERRGDRAAKMAARQRVIELTGQMQGLTAERFQSRMQASDLLSQTLTVPGQAAISTARANLASFGSLGVADGRVDQMFTRLERGFDMVLSGMRRRLEMDRPMLGREGIRQREAEIEQTRVQQSLVGIERILETLSLRSAPFMFQAQAATAAGQGILLTGGSSQASMPAFSAVATNLGQRAALAHQALDQATAEGREPGMLARLRAEASQADLAATSAAHAIPMGQMGAGFDIAMTREQAHLQRQLSSFTEPGSVLDTRQNLMRLYDRQLHQMDAERARLQQQGLWDSGREAEYTRARTGIEMEKFGQRQAIDEGWVERLTSMSISEPSSAMRLKPTLAEAARALDDRGMQSRAFGTVSQRGAAAERERGLHTGGSNVFDLYPGDLALHGAGAAASRSMVGTDSTQGRGPGATTPAGSAGSSVMPALTPDGIAQNQAHWQEMVRRHGPPVGGWRMDRDGNKIAGSEWGPGATTPAATPATPAPAPQRGGGTDPFSRFAQALGLDGGGGEQQTALMLQMVDLLGRIATAMEAYHALPGGGPAPMGGVGTRSWIDDVSLGPQPGDSTRGRNR